MQESFRVFKRACLANGADDVPYLVGGAGAGGYRDVISPPSPKPLEPGDVLMLDTGAVFDGYYCDFDRNYAIGFADDASKNAHDVLWRATEAGRKSMIPGATCREVYEAMQAVIGELDISSNDVGRLGHGLDMQLTEWPSLAAFDETILQENMVMTLEPSLSYGAGRLMVHEENLVIKGGEAHYLVLAHHESYLLFLSLKFFYRSPVRCKFRSASQPGIVGSQKVSRRKTRVAEIAMPGSIPAAVKPAATAASTAPSPPGVGAA